jgi:hypothetical protein
VSTLLPRADALPALPEVLELESRRDDLAIQPRLDLADQELVLVLRARGSS